MDYDYYTQSATTFTLGQYEHISCVGCSALAGEKGSSAGAWTCLTGKGVGGQKESEKD